MGEAQRQDQPGQPGQSHQADQLHHAHQTDAGAHLEQRITALVEKLGIAWTVVEHRAVNTVAEALAWVPPMDGIACKNLFLRCTTQKHGPRQYWLICTPFAKRVDLKALGRLLGAGSRLSFAKEEELMDLLGLHPGSVTPLAIICDTAARVSLVLDNDIVGATVLMHPGTNTKTAALTYDDLLRYVKATGHTVQCVTVPVRPEEEQGS